MSFLVFERNTATIVARSIGCKRFVFVMISALFYSSSAQAQACVVPILANSVEVRQATCVGSIATLQGTTPVGGNGTYNYQWQRSAGNCNNFANITGATAKDYAVPAGTDPTDCFRRVVTSASCTNTSNTERVELNERTTPVPPTITVVNSTCVVISCSVYTV